MDSSKINGQEESQVVLDTNSEEISKESDITDQVAEINKPTGVKVIRGEKAVFNKLTKAIKEAKELVCTTRLSSHPLDSRKDHLADFANSLWHVHTRSNPISDTLKRIIVVNSYDKLQGVDELLNAKIRISLYLMTPTNDYNFEIVIIDNKKAFVLYRDKNTKADDLCSYAFYCENEAFVQKEMLLFNRLTKQAEEQEKNGDAMIIEKNNNAVIIRSKGSKTEGDKLKAMEEVKRFFDEKLSKQTSSHDKDDSDSFRMGS